MAKRQMTVEQLVLSMFGATTASLSKEEYQLVGLSKLNILKRRRFVNVYKTLILFLIRLSLPGSFTTHSSELVKTFDRYFQMAYENSPTARERMEERLTRFQELTKLDEQEPFQDLALHIAEQFEHRPSKLVYAVILNRRINDMFFNFLNLGNEIEIKDG